MGLIHSLATWYLKKRIHQVELFKKYPVETQLEVFHSLIHRAKNTSFGSTHKLGSANSVEQFQEQVPLHSYEQIFPWIERMMMGEKNVLWPGRVNWFSKSSGTTNGRSKYIPVTKESLQECHFKCGKDMLALYFQNHPDSKGFAGKALSVGGSSEINPLNSKTWCGDLSAILIHNMPMFYEMFRTPGKKIALMPDWEKKIDEMAKAAMQENVTTLVGVPTWTSLLLKKVIEFSGKKNISEVWPSLEVFFHGGVNFEPYRGLFDSLFGAGRVEYFETYNASEGFFALQDEPGRDDMLLMLDCGIFYEFVPVDELQNDKPVALQLSEVETGKNYAIVITTNGGLWRYMPGDTVRFTTTNPYRLRITGRTKQFINAFGEELVVENAESALAETCRITNTKVSDFTVAPIFFERGGGAHEWLIEFISPPDDLSLFTAVLDSELRNQNSDYDAKRSGDLALQLPIVKVLPTGSFYEWLRAKGKLGGQNKIPRLSNSRVYVDELTEIVY